QLCNATCWIEEQSTMRAYNVTSNVESYRMCVLYCGNDPRCVSASYSEATRVCHNQVPSTLPMCTVPPFRRFVRTMTGCIGADLGVTYVRKDLSLEHGVDPCVPAALLHADSALWAQRPLASNGESTTLMDPCLDGNGKYESYGIHNGTTFAYDATSNSFMVRYKPDFGMTVTYLCISGFCAEEDPFDSECCAPLPPFTITTLTNPAPAQFNTSFAK
ncbi:hypothetical protein PRIPAC_97208, partial [Pristionchus pacificus]|uniref:Uncharacterized protein n=1 Tax=Pristionchus pacificus TaxID=54126 RepID=A0A2A6D286_PRIPA